MGSAGAAATRISLKFEVPPNDHLEMDDRLYAHRYRQLVERLPVIVYRASIRSGDWHYVSPAIERVLGWTPEEWRAHEAPWGTSLLDDDREAALRQEELALETGLLRSEYRLRHKDGGIVWIRDEATLLEEEGEPQWHGILTDVTEQRTLESRLRQSQKLEAVGQLAGGIAHDFNNLLVAISGYGELALLRAGDDAELRHDIEQIGLAADRARDLTQRLLSFSRKEARTRETVDLNDVVASTHPMLRRVLGANLELVTVPADEPCTVSADPTELHQSLLNLCVNARDAMPHGGRLSISTGVAQRSGTRYAFLRVSRHRHGNRPRARAARLRALLHDERGGPRHRARTGDGERVRRRLRRRRRARHEPRLGDVLHPAAAARRASGRRAPAPNRMRSRAPAARGSS